VSRYNGNWNPPPEPTDVDSSSERRRIGRIVHDDRGTASLEWRDAPRGEERQRFEIEETRGGSRGDPKLRRGLDVPPLSIKNDDTFNPYDRSPDPDAKRDASARSGKRDLRKLSEWMKMMRELEERKKKEGEG